MKTNFIALFYIIFSFSCCKTQEEMVKPVYVSKYQKILSNTNWHGGRMEVNNNGEIDYDYDIFSYEIGVDSVTVKEFYQFYYKCHISFNDSGFVFHRYRYDEKYKIKYIDSTKMIVVTTNGKLTLTKTLHKF